MADSQTTAPKRTTYYMVVNPQGFRRGPKRKTETRAWRALLGQKTCDETIASAKLNGYRIERIG